MQCFVVLYFQWDRRRDANPCESRSARRERCRHLCNREISIRRQRLPCLGGLGRGFFVRAARCFSTLRRDLSGIANRLLLCVRAESGHSLYIRPTGIATYGALGVGVSKAAKIFTITCPVGPYYPEGFAPVSLLAETQYVRAWPGGAGGCKIGAYVGRRRRVACGLRGAVEVGCQRPRIVHVASGTTRRQYSRSCRPPSAASRRCCGWLAMRRTRTLAVRSCRRLCCRHHRRHWETLFVCLFVFPCSEVGTMNFFLFWKNSAGETELITPPLDGTILPGVTRDV